MMATLALKELRATDFLIDFAKTFDVIKMFLLRIFGFVLQLKISPLQSLEHLQTNYTLT